jgi:hypothetical protein
MPIAANIGAMQTDALAVRIVDPSKHCMVKGAPPVIMSVGKVWMTAQRRGYIALREVYATPGQISHHSVTSH